MRLLLAHHKICGRKVACAPATLVTMNHLSKTNMILEETTDETY